jgi:hypothetical protein
MRLEFLCFVTVLCGAACSRDSTPSAESAEATPRVDSTVAAPRPSSSVGSPRTASGDPSGDSPASDGAPQVSEHGVGPVKIGMTLAEARAATAGSLSAPRAADTAACGFAKWTTASGSMRMMTAKGRIVRVDVDSAGTATAAGARIGDTEARIATLYPGRVETTPHKYTSGHYLTIKPATAADSAYRIVFETDGRKVTRYRAGRRPEVGYVEGCG